MISDDSGEFYFNNVKVDKDGWLSAAEGHHDLFDNIKNDSEEINITSAKYNNCLLYTSPSPRDRTRSRMPSSA